MKASDWKPVGQLVSKLQDLFAVVRDTFTEMGIGFDIIPWLVGDGKGVFVEKLKALGMEFNKTQRIRLTDDKNVMYVNLDDANGVLYVRYLHFYDGAWRSLYCRLAYDWYGYNPAALRAS